MEFILTLLLLVAFILFFFQLTMIFSFGNYVHYATFMSARAYLSAGRDEQDQRERAMNVLVKMVKKSEGTTGIDKFPSIAKGSGGGETLGIKIGPGSEFVDGNRRSSWMQGVRYTFKSKLFLIPLAGFGKKGASANSIELTSESWLGREPSDSECNGAMVKGGMNGLLDNGC